MASLRQQGLKPRVPQDEEQFLVRIRQKGYAKLQVALESRAKAKACIKKD